MSREGLSPTPVSLFLLRKDEMATARDRHDCPGIKTLSRDSRNFCPSISQAGILVPKYLFHLEGKTRVIKSWTEKPEQNSACESKAMMSYVFF